MAYLQSQEHFLNYINKALRQTEEPPDSTQLLTANFYITHIYNEGYGDVFTWALRKEGLHLLERRHVLEWIEKVQHPPLPTERFQHKLDERFLEILEDLDDRMGVYGYWDEDDFTLYVGKSINLGQRALSSFIERFGDFNHSIFFRYIKTTTDIDAALLEIHFINTLNPTYNKEYNRGYRPHKIEISPIPDWSNRIPCNILEEQENGSETIPTE